MVKFFAWVVLVVTLVVIMVGCAFIYLGVTKAARGEFLHAKDIKACASVGLKWEPINSYLEVRNASAVACDKYLAELQARKYDEDTASIMNSLVK